VRNFVFTNRKREKGDRKINIRLLKQLNTRVNVT